MIIEAVDILMEGLTLIELENIDLFIEKSFSEYYWINYLTNVTLMFTKESEKLPNYIIEKAEKMCRAIADKTFY